MDEPPRVVVPFDMALRLRRERLREGDSVAEFARRLGVSKTKLEAWEAGREQPHPDVRLRLNPQRVFSIDNPPPPHIRDLILKGLEETSARLAAEEAAEAEERD